MKYLVKTRNLILYLDTLLVFRIIGHKRLCIGYLHNRNARKLQPEHIQREWIDLKEWEFERATGLK